MLELLLIVALLLLAVLCLMAGIVALFRLRILLGLLLLGGFVVLVVLAFCMGFLAILWKFLQEYDVIHTCYTTMLYIYDEHLHSLLPILL